MKEEEKTKKSSKKWLIAIVLVVIIASIALAFYQGIIPTGLMANTLSGGAVGNPTTGAAVNPATEPPKFTVTGNEIIAKELTENLPYYEAIDLEAGRYTINFLSDELAWIFVYNEARFNQWKDGKHTFIVAGTACCNDQYKVKSLSETFDIPTGENGKYYIVIEGAEKASIKFKVTQILKF